MILKKKPPLIIKDTNYYLNRLKKQQQERDRVNGRIKHTKEKLIEMGVEVYPHHNRSGRKLLDYVSIQLQFVTSDKDKIEKIGLEKFKKKVRLLAKEFLKNYKL